MRQNVEGDCFSVFRVILRKADQLADKLLPAARLQDSEANALLDRNFSPTGGIQEATSDKLSTIIRVYRLTADDESCGARAWWAIQHAAFVVKQDLFSMATYAKTLERENQRLHRLLQARTT